MKTAASNNEILTNDLRKILKETMQKELQQLPATLAALEPKERINVLCKLMPFVFPKLEAVHFEQGEPDDF